MENERIIKLSWVERYNIRSALTLEVERMNELRDYVMRTNHDEKTIRALETGINDYLHLVDKMRDRG